MTRRISVRGITLNQGKLLCVRLKPYKASLIRDNSYWCLPGGGLDDGESLVAGLEREMLEETGTGRHLLSHKGDCPQSAADVFIN